MSAPVVLRDVFRGLGTELGEEDAGYTYDDGPGPISRLDVMVYPATSPADATIFATIGMSIEPMPSRDARAELRLHCRGAVSPADRERISLHLANLAGYPWTTGRLLGWGEIVTLSTPMPTFPTCQRVFLAGPWMQGQPSAVDTEVGPVRVISVVPITEAERERALVSHPQAFFSDLLDARDVLSGPPLD
jgi:hypothetical protein